MGTKWSAAYFLLLALLLTVRGAHEPLSGQPSFVRSAVESMPRPDENTFAKYSVPPTFGEVFLPLRSAVESAPTSAAIRYEPTKTFIRSSVEQRPAHEYLGESAHFRIAPFVQQPEKQEHFAAYVAPSAFRSSLPQPFRSGSPYQTLVDPSELQDDAFGDDTALVRSSLTGERYRASKSNTPKVLCYLTNWAFYRTKEGKFAPENLDTSLCSAVIYSFASLDPETLMIREFDPWVDIDNDLYQRTTALDIPVLLALGGWTDSTGDKYSKLVSNPASRTTFAANLVAFLVRYGFRGLHLDWNYPKCWQSDCRKGPVSDKPNFTQLIKDIRREFNRRDSEMQLGIAISGYKEVIREAYELDLLSQQVDYLTVMSYDYHGAWELQTGHVSPLYGRPGDKYAQYNTDYTMKLLVDGGADKSKLIMGIPFYGQSFTLAQSFSILVGEGIPARAPGEPGEFTRQPGMLAYYEICYRIRNNKWHSSRDSSKKSGPYAMLRNQWVSYEDPESAETKARYALNAGFGGIAAWTVDLDDFQNRCCGESFPLLKAINRGLGRLDIPPPSGSNCQRPAEPVTPVAPVMTTVSDDGVPNPIHQHTTWPSWMPSPTTPGPSTSTTRRTTAASTWWPQPTTTTTTPRPRPTTTRRTTTEYYHIESTTIPVPAVVMPVFENDEAKCDQTEIFKAHPNNCNAYYQCVYGELRQQFCPGGLHWNARNKLCDWPEAAKCEEKVHDMVTPGPPPAPTTTTTVRTTTQRHTQPTRRTTTPRPQSYYSTAAPPSEGCTDGQYYAHSECERFYICINGKRVEQNCGAWLYWSTDLNGCDWADNVNCLSKSKYLRLIDSRLAPGDPCDGQDYISYPGDCGQYLRCLWGRLEAYSCASGLHWNSQQKICDWSANAQCVQSEGIDNSINQGVGSPAGGQPAPTQRPVTTPQPTYPTDRPVVEPLSGYYKVVCYFTNWAWYRKGFGRYTPDDINTDLCTHIVYGFAVLDYSELTIKTHDSWADLDNKFYTRVADLKKKGVKVSLALGGWNDSQGDKYSRLVRNPAARSKFVRQAVEFVGKYGFEGLDLDWEYPVCWQTECDKGFPDEKQGYTELVRELSQAFKPQGWLLSTAVSPSKKIIDAGYDVPALSQYFDWIAVMTYDFHGQWDKKTGHVAPLFYHPDDDFDYFNANFSLNYWIEKGAPSRKIIMGMPLYGQSFTLADTKINGLNAHAPGPGTAGEFTSAAGFLAYYEICDRIKTKGWNVIQDEQGRMGPYAFKGNQWVSFDDKDTIRKKSQMVRALNLGGGMIWALDLDDFKNRCGEGVHPLLTTIHDVLKHPPKGYEPLPGLEPEKQPSPPDIGHYEPGQQPANNQNQGRPPISDPNLEVEQAPVFNPIDNNIVPSSTDFKVVCYFTNWAWYRQSGGKYIPEDIDANLCTHIVYGFAVLDRDSLTIKPHDSWADLDNKFYERVVAFKAKGIKVTLAIGGWNDSAGDKYSRLVLSAAARARFVKHVISFIEKYGFEGLDLDWEYPVCWQVDCTKGVEEEKQGFSDLVRELSHAFKPKGLLLSSAVSPNQKVIDAGYDVPALSEHFDWIAVMAYDYHGQWDKKTGHVAPMYEHPEDENPTFNANFSLNYWIEKGADRKKLIMGMPMYGQSFSLADNSRHDLNSPTYGGGEAGDGTRARGFLSYYEICENIRNRNWQVVRDRRGRMGPYAYLRDQWVSFDDAPMIRHKSEYVKAMELGGAMIWALDLDDFRNVCQCEKYPLLKTINRVLRNYPGPSPTCKLEDMAEIAPDKPNVSVAPHSSTQRPYQQSSTRRTTPQPTTQKPPKPTTQRPTTQVVASEPLQQYDKPVEENMSCNNRNFAPHRTDCNKYYVCQFQVLKEQSCPQGLHWNNGYCDWPHNTKCQSSLDDPTATTAKPVPVPAPTHPKPIAEKPTKKPVEYTTKKPIQKPKPPTVRPPVYEGDGKYKVVCYFTNWAWYRPGDGKYTPDDIDENLCTHVVYGFAVLDRDSLTIKTHDSWADIDNRFYERVVELKNKGIRVTLAIGGWNDSLGDKYSRLVRNPQARARFVKHVVEFLEKYGFEGLDLDWEYPVCWQVECEKGFPDEKDGFSNLVRELSQEFRPRGLLLSTAVSPSKKVIDAGYDVPVLSQYFDWIAVMTYDFHGHWDKQTGHVAPLYYVPGDSYDYFNGNFSINYWIEKGAPPSKLVMGMPLYGQSFSLADNNNRGLNEKTYGPGEAGQFTRAGGFLAYYEICEKVNRGGWTVVRDTEGRIGPYAYSGSQWVSYDDVAEIRRKSQFLKSLKLGGGMVWALDLDDFRGKCGCGKHPLLRTLNQELRGIAGQRASDCT